MNLRTMTFSAILQFEAKTKPAGIGWADFLFDLGSQFASLEAEEKNVTALLVVPVVDMAAPLLALGYLHSKFNRKKHRTLDIDFFRTLPEGSALIYRSKDGPQHAVFSGVKSILDKTVKPAREIECVSVRFQSHKKGSGTSMLLPDQLDKITVVSSDQELSERDLGKDAVGMNRFARSVFGPATDMSGVLNSVWMIGKFAELQWELTGVPLLSNGKTGTFNDLMRVDQFINAREPSFARLVSCFKADLDYEDTTDAAQLTLFRESASYLKHRHNYSHGSKILLMDFADRDLDVVIESYNQRYYERAEDWSFDLTKSIGNTMFSAYLEAA